MRVVVKRQEEQALETLKGHDLIVARSRALHRAVADKLRANPDLLHVVRANLERWIAEERRQGVVSSALLEWKARLEKESIEGILRLISTPSEDADRLRHATPFCGILTQEERDTIYKRYASVPA